MGVEVFLFLFLRELRWFVLERLHRPSLRERVLCFGRMGEGCWKKKGKQKGKDLMGGK